MTVIFTKIQLKLLDLSTREHRVLAFLQPKPECMLVISKKTKIPRATLYLIIKKLYRRELIRVGKEGHRYVYQTLPNKDLKAKFQEIVSLF